MGPRLAQLPTYTPSARGLGGYIFGTKDFPIFPKTPVKYESSIERVTGGYLREYEICSRRRRPLRLRSAQKVAHRRQCDGAESAPARTHAQWLRDWRKP